MSDHESPSLDELLERANRHIDAWEASWGEYEVHPALQVEAERVEAAFDAYLERLEGNYPFFHPRYAGQMLKPAHPVAVAAYHAAQRINPNNHALDGGPPTGEMEKEVVADLAAMLGFPEEHLGHLTGGGTVANLEALWVAREMHPEGKIAFSSGAHYTHRRMCKVLDVAAVEVPTAADGRIDLDALEAVLKNGDVGTVVLTAGTTGLGVVDPLKVALPLCREYGARVHVDAAYGGFFRLLCERNDLPEGFPADDLRAIGRADSVVIDPHKHGLQPYGCGCIIFRDPAVGTVYQHDSPYTYFTSDELHLGEISLECSRAGASAGALWCTLRAIPLQAEDGLGAILSASTRAAQRWKEEVEDASHLRMVAHPQLDIVTFTAETSTKTLTKMDGANRQLFDRAMNDADEPVFLSLYRLPAEKLKWHFSEVQGDGDAAVLRSVLMKPEHETYAGELVARLDELAAKVAD